MTSRFFSRVAVVRARVCSRAPIRLGTVRASGYRCEGSGNQFLLGILVWS